MAISRPTVCSKEDEGLASVDFIIDGKQKLRQMTVNDFLWVET